MKKIIFLTIFLGVLSCNRQEDAETYVQFVKNPDNGLHQSFSEGPLQATVQYQPPSYLALFELREEALEQPFKFWQTVDKYKDLHHFTLKLGINEPQKNIINYQAGTDDMIQQRLYYLSYHMQQDIYLVEGQDTLPCIGYHFERSYDLPQSRTFNLAFKNTGQKTDKKLIVDSPLFNHDVLEFKIRQTDLAQVPSLRL